MPIGSKGGESSLHDAEGETRHPIIPCGAHHPLPPDLFDLHARTPKDKNERDVTNPAHGGTRNAKKTISSWVLSAQAFRRAAGAPERTRSCRTRPAAAVAVVAPLPPARPAEHPCRPPRPPALATSRVPARAWPAAPFLEPNWRRNRARRPEKWRFTPGPAAAQSTEPTARFFLEG